MNIIKRARLYLCGTKGPVRCRLVTELCPSKTSGENAFTMILRFPKQQSRSIAMHWAFPCLTSCTTYPDSHLTVVDAPIRTSMPSRMKIKILPYSCGAVMRRVPHSWNMVHAMQASQRGLR
jgi:hypothetical protein